jgi:LmbE family N-acetylglucosaminyl deacetylase
VTSAFAPPSSVLTVMAHPDDAELWAGGTLARCTAFGAAVTIAVPHHHEQRRNSEAAAGAVVLGAQLYSYDEPTVNTLRDLLLAVSPEVVITHPLHDVHPEHRGLAESLSAALPEVVIATGHPQRLYTADSYNSLTNDGPIPAHTIVDITDTYETKRKALAAHVSQPIEHHFGPMAETLARLWGARIGTRFAENFIPQPILGRLSPAATL